MILLLQMTIPARVLHNLDSEPRPVSRASKQLLAMIDKLVYLPYSLFVMIRL